MAATPPKRHKRKSGRVARSGPKLVTTAGVRAIVRRELVKDLQPKAFDYLQLPVSVDSGTTGFYNVQISTIVQFNASVGPVPNTRLAQRISCSSLELRGSWSPASTLADVSNVCRLMVVLTFKPEGTYPTIPDVIPDGVGTAAAPYAPLQILNFKTGHYYRMLWDRTFMIGPGYLPGHFEVVIPLNNLLMTYNDALGTDQLTNSLSILAITDSAVSPDPSLSYIARINFVDEQ
jgi:hypothetical protein